MLKFDFNLGEQKVKFELMKQCCYKWEPHNRAKTAPKPVESKIDGYSSNTAGQH